MGSPKSEDLIEGALLGFNEQLSEAMAAEVIFVGCPMTPPWDDVLRVSVESLAEARKLPEKLIVVLETGGGYIETVERMVRVMRTHFAIVDFVVPNFAYSAGTVLALSGDDIWMDYHSVLGPIDPQYGSPNGNYVPGMGYLAKYQELVEKINAAPDASKVRAEVAFLVEKFDPAHLFRIEQAIEHSKTLLKAWLPKYKFKDWERRTTSGAVVSAADKQVRANQIAETLGDAAKWHSHGRGITCDDLGDEEIKLKINNYGKDAHLRTAIRNYYSLLGDYLGKRDWKAAIHTRNGFGGMQ
ncbi:SDH family Clp fold serine proteinase [Arenimonas terrae]|uniref:Serine dehydrogenasease n=1 Tax=Arenimonas terrae TaxID=2546226 RepID=A0A5C4RX20_9GAMM|nr:serine dehydrogenasease [Arenimonas terrae]TNJ35449.1 serine dehydrogenasease [Arenimonas terrae]